MGVVALDLGFMVIVFVDFYLVCCLSLESVV